MSTDNFTPVIRGSTDDFIPGNSLVNNTEHPFHSLKATSGNIDGQMRAKYSMRY